jgi:GNAT superfamily N-acetyltransferase
MKENIQIRPATIADLQLLIDNNQAMALETENRVLEDAVLRLGVSAVLNDPAKGFYLIAAIEGRLVGSLMITSEWSDWRNGEMWWYQSVYVLPEYRAKGVFKAMFQNILDLARNSNVKELRLYVERDNIRAQKVYEALGMAHSHYDMWEITL